MRISNILLAELRNDGIKKYGYRWSDPVTGLWASRDPIQEMGGPNLYGFTENRPTGHFDYLGRETVGTGQSADNGGYPIELGKYDPNRKSRPDSSCVSVATGTPRHFIPDKYGMKDKGCRELSSKNKDCEKGEIRVLWYAWQLGGDGEDANRANILTVHMIGQNGCESRFYHHQTGKGEGSPYFGEVSDPDVAARAYYKWLRDHGRGDDQKGEMITIIYCCPCKSHERH